MSYLQIFSRLWDDYTSQNPTARMIHDLFESRAESVENDHIAFRTFSDPRINIDVLARPFLQEGYVMKGSYHFEEKRLFARHYEHPVDKTAPKIFISELLTEYFSEFLKATVREIADKISPELTRSGSLIFSGNTWGIPSYDVYKRLLEESEYAAWMYVYGFRANHFTVSVNALKSLDSIEAVNQLLKENGYQLNTSGGEVKGSEKELLKQSSTLAEIIPVQFEEGIFNIPACYYEFAQRFADADGKLFSGFISQSADKIFESTNFRQ